MYLNLCKPNITNYTLAVDNFNTQKTQLIAKLYINWSTRNHIIDDVAVFV